MTALVDCRNFQTADEQQPLYGLNFYQISFEKKIISPSPTLSSYSSQNNLHHIFGRIRLGKLAKIIA